MVSRTSFSTRVRDTLPTTTSIMRDVTICDA